MKKLLGVQADLALPAVGSFLIGILALLGLTTLSGCGVTQTNPSLFSNNQGGNGYCTGANLYNDPACWGAGSGGFIQISANVWQKQTPLYASGAIQKSGSQFTATIGSVAIGDKVALPAAVNSVYVYRSCQSGIINVNFSQNTFPIQAPALAVNGAMLPNSFAGTVTVTSSGPLQFVATSAVSTSCGLGINPQWYFINAAGYFAQVATLFQCRDGSQNAIPCP